MSEYVIWFNDLGMNDVDRVGGKNASLGEMISQLSQVGVSVPGGFATTADAFRDFLQQSGLNDRIIAALDGFDIEDVKNLAVVGKKIRQWIVETPFPEALNAAVVEAYAKLVDGNDAMSFTSRLGHACLTMKLPFIF